MTDLQKIFVSVSLVIIVVFVCVGVGCTATEKKTDDAITPTWSMSDNGHVNFTLPGTTPATRILETNENYTVEDLIFSGFSGDVHAVLVTPKNPSTILIWAPGANNAAINVSEYLKEYTLRNIGVCVLDIRGNGGGSQTPGYPMNIQKDLDLYLNGEWPEFYLIAGDLIRIEKFLKGRYPSVPVWMVGESNGGRYAALAASVDRNVTGYIGISTSGFGRMGDKYQSPVREFLLSIDPDVTAPAILPRQIVLFHAPKDPIIPFKEGEALAKNIGNDTRFIPFNGTHGVNREVDGQIYKIL